MENYLSVSNIQRVCFHDGPGIRTTVFLNACSLKCPWCANPETSIHSKKFVVNKNCKIENNKCKYGLDCNGKNSTMETLEKNHTKCPVEAIEQMINLYNVSELENIILQDKSLYGKDGGVTFSGGEPLLQSENLSVLMNKLKEQGINIAVESCMYVEHEKLKQVIDYVDLFIIDIKILNEDKAKEILGGNINMYLENIKFIFSKNKKVIFRIPLISPYIANDENLSKIYEFLEEYTPQKVEIFKGHNLAKEKYLKLGLDYKVVETINDEEIKKIKNEIEEKGIKADIISF